MKILTQHSRWFEPAISILVFIILFMFTYEVFFQIPYAGFEISNDNISVIFNKVPGSDALQVGDRLIKIGGVDFADFSRDLRVRLFENVTKGQVFPLVIERKGQTFSINWILPGPTREQTLERFNSQWWFPYVFWFAGTVALLLIRPRSTQWVLFIALTYLTAIWLGAGSGPSHWHLGQSAILLRSAVWLSLPVYLHFHWLFPRSLRKLPGVVWGVFYVGAAVLAILEWFQVLPANSYLLGMLIALAGSILLLFIHYILQRDVRQDILMLIASAVLTISPLILISLALLFGTNKSFLIEGAALLALPAIPGAYFYAMFRHQYKELIPRTRRVVRIYLIAIILTVLFVAILSIFVIQFHFEEYTTNLGLAGILIAGIVSLLTFFPFLILPALAESSSQSAQGEGFRLRANRLLSYYLFFSLVGMISAIILFPADRALHFEGKTTVFGTFIGVAAGIVAVFGFDPFRRLIERRVLGVPLPPTHLLETYSSKITTSLDLQNLAHLICDEILPSLFVRQSALLKISDRNTSEVVFSLGIEKDQLPSSAELNDMLGQDLHGHYSLNLGSWPVPYTWVRVIFPLRVEKHIIGAWLLGSRDPEDIYAESELAVLETIANQTAIALVNIDQAKRLHALLQADIQRQDFEQTRLARLLHDVVLNQLGSLSIRSESRDDGAEFQEELQKAIDYLREIVDGLRPTMLSFGLYLGLTELVDQLNDRGLDGKSVDLEVPPTNCRYDPNIEQNLYWIIHQACENAVRHSNGKKITIHGALKPEEVNLVVEDDGVGFSSGGHLDIPDLLVARHYGLVGMHERADLIGAGLQIDTSLQRGTKVSVELVIEQGML